MRLSIAHTTEYDYDEDVTHGLMQTRLTARSGPTQTIEGWSVTIENGTREVEFVDHHGNPVQLSSIDPDTRHVEVTVEGVAETHDTRGIISHHDAPVPLWLYLRPTAATRAGNQTRRLCKGISVSSAGDVGALHDLSSRIRDAVTYETGRTTVSSTAEDSIEAGVGVCQDHAHIFLAACRHLDVPARYVSGYLRIDDRDAQDASHAWADAWVDDLGWVGFDISNGISPDERYVRIATGLDYTDAAPIAGVRRGSAGESLRVSLTVTEQETQSQQ